MKKCTYIFQTIFLAFIALTVLCQDIKDEWDYYQDGIAALRARNITGYLDSFQKAAAINPGDKFIIMHIARAYALNGDARNAADWLKKQPVLELALSAKNDPAFEKIRETNEIKAAFAYQENRPVELLQAAEKIYVTTNLEANLTIYNGQDGFILVDTGLEEGAGKLLEALKKLRAGEIKYIINTHWHPDHVGGNLSLGKNVPMIGHTNCRKRLSEDQKLLGNVSKALPKEALPGITIDTPVTIYFDGEEVDIYPLEAGHSDGDLIVYFKNSKVLSLGGAYYAGMLPFMDEVSQNASINGLIRDIEWIINTFPLDVKIIPGHGPLSSMDNLKEYLEMLKETTSYVKKLADEGKTLGEIQKMGIPSKYKPWQQRFMADDNWLRFLYECLKAKK